MNLSERKGLQIPSNIEFAVADNYDIALNTKMNEEELKTNNLL